MISYRILDNSLYLIKYRMDKKKEWGKKQRLVHTRRITNGKKDYKPDHGRKLNVSM